MSQKQKFRTKNVDAATTTTTTIIITIFLVVTPQS